MKKSLKHAILIFFSTATVLFIIFSPIFFKKDQIKSFNHNAVSAENDKKDISNSSAEVITQLENHFENKSEDKKEPVSLENNNQSNGEEELSENQKEVVETSSFQVDQPSSTPIPSPSSAIIIYSSSATQGFVTVEIQGLSNFQVGFRENDTAFSVLLRAGEENNFTISYQNYGSLGAFISCIADVCSYGNYYWAFYYNGQYSSLGASGQPVADNDTTSWKFED